MTRALLPLLVVVGVVIYAALAGIALKFWREHTSRTRPASIEADPHAWVRYWQPQILVMGLSVPVLVVCLYLVFDLATTVFRGPDAIVYNLGWWGGLFLAELVVLGSEIYLLTSARRLARRQQAAMDADDHS